MPNTSTSSISASFTVNAGAVERSDERHHEDAAHERVHGGRAPSRWSSAGSSPISSCASRNAVSASVSPGSCNPRERDSPAWRDSAAARTVKTIDGRLEDDRGEHRGETVAGPGQGRRVVVEGRGERRERVGV